MWLVFSPGLNPVIPAHALLDPKRRLDDSESYQSYIVEELFAGHTLSS